MGTGGASVFLTRAVNGELAEVGDAAFEKSEVVSKGHGPRLVVEDEVDAFGEGDDVGVEIGVLMIWREELVKPRLQENAGLVMAEVARRFDIDHGGVIDSDFVAASVRDNDDWQSGSWTEIPERPVQHPCI